MQNSGRSSPAITRWAEREMEAERLEKGNRIADPVKRKRPFVNWAANSRLNYNPHPEFL